MFGTAIGVGSDPPGLIENIHFSLSFKPHNEIIIESIGPSLEKHDVGTYQEQKTVDSSKGIDVDGSAGANFE